MNTPVKTSAEAISEIDNLAKQHGWTAVEINHAKTHLYYDGHYKNEVVVKVEGGREIRTPDLPRDSEYVRITQGGYELGYWDADTWRTNPVSTMGSILDCARRGEK